MIIDNVIIVYGEAVLYKKRFILYFNESLFKAFIATSLFVLVYLFSHIEIIRANIEDIAFDLLNKYTLESKKESSSTTNLLLFKIDDYYLKEYDLIDNNGVTNYGYLFPRDHIARFIQNLDAFIEELEVKPKALFIDYDFSYTSLPYSKELSNEDKALISVLKQKRSYAIFLPKTSNYNFIESAPDSKLQELIKLKKINFVSVGLVESSDDMSRRYHPVNVFNEKNYIHVNLAIRDLLNESRASQIGLEKELKITNDIENRILYRNYEEKIDEDNYEMYLSNWQNFFVYSANYPLDEIIEENFYNSVIFLGGTHSNNDDVFQVASIKNEDILSGIEVQANALMSLFYFNGQLQKFDIYKSTILVFTLFFLVNFILELLFDLFGLQERRNLEFIVLLVVLSGTMLYLSYYILVEYKQWFNWFIPVILFEAIEIIELIKRYSVKSYAKIKEKRREKINSIT